MIEGIPEESEGIIFITIAMDRKIQRFRELHKETYVQLIKILEAGDDSTLIFSLARAISESKETDTEDYLINIITPPKKRKTK